jgi:peptidyl-prolyl cis-trans isomerase B (cyclophilin B)
MQPPGGRPVVATTYVSTGYVTTTSAGGTNGFAVASLVLGLVGVPILAVVFGHVALHQMRSGTGPSDGRGMAVAGLVLGYVFLGLLAVFAVAALAVSAGNSG